MMDGDQNEVGITIQFINIFFVSIMNPEILLGSFIHYWFIQQILIEHLLMCQRL